MTITTAKQPAARALTLAPLAIAAMLWSAQCRADWKITPQLELRETYSDNVALLPDNVAQGSWVSQISPSVSVIENGPRLKLNGNARFNSYAYSNSDAPNLRNNDSQYNANGQANLIDQLLYLDGSASSSRQTISAFGPNSSNSFSNNNNADLRTWRISPYLRHRFGSFADLEVRYSRDSVSGGGAGYGDSMSSTRSANLNGVSSRGVFGWGLSYYHQDLDEQYAGRSSMQSSQANVRYFLVRRFALTASAGYDDYEYQVATGSTSGRSWTVGFDWEPSSRTSVKANWGRRYFGKTGALDASYRTQHTTASLVYTDQVTTSRQQFLQTSSFDTAAMYDALFAATYPDPALRQEVVQAYIAQLGLPATLTNSINYLSNRYERDRRLQGNLAFRGSRSGLLFSVFSDRRNSLSLGGTGNALLDDQLSNYNDNIKQRGASASFDYRLSSRTNANAGLYTQHSTSLDGRASGSNNDLRLGLTHAFGSRMNGSVEYRHSRGDYGLNSAPYHENAISAMLALVY
jgi:uncharacterized protein (PEP-CTERM system associated)